MHVSSTTTNTKSTHDVPVILLAFSDAEGTIHSRKFIARPTRYVDLITIARKVLGLENDASLEFGTTTLDVCRGDWVEIDESAYAPLAEFLDEVIVRLVSSPSRVDVEARKINPPEEEPVEVLYQGGDKAREPQPAPEDSTSPGETSIGSHSTTLKERQSAASTFPADASETTSATSTTGTRTTTTRLPGRNPRGPATVTITDWETLPTPEPEPEPSKSEPQPEYSPFSPRVPTSRCTPLIALDVNSNEVSEPKPQEAVPAVITVEKASKKPLTSKSAATRRKYRVTSPVEEGSEPGDEDEDENEQGPKPKPKTRQPRQQKAEVKPEPEHAHEPQVEAEVAAKVEHEPLQPEVKQQPRSKFRPVASPKHGPVKPESPESQVLKAAKRKLEEEAEVEEDEKGKDSSEAPQPMPRPRQPRHPRGKANNIKPEGRAQQPHVEAQEEEIDPEPESMEKQKSKFRPASSSAASTSSTNPRRAESSRTVRHKIKPVRKEEEEEEEEEGIAHAKIEVASPSHLPPPPDQEIEEDENFWRFGTKSPDTQGHALTRMEAATEIGQSNASTPLRRDLLEVKEEPNVEDERRARVSSASTNLTLPDNSQRIPLASTRPARIANNNPELRFRVVVYGPYNDQVSEFRMRGGHPVQKVLEAVCRTFEVPFELSYLILLEEENGEDQMYLCSLDETIGDCGITSTSILIVQAPGWQREERLDRREEEEEEEE